MNEPEFKFAFNGYRVYSDPNMLEDEEEIVRLSVKEALFSWPWKPFKRSYVVKKKVASKHVLMKEIDGNRALIAHPYTVSIMSRMIIDKINESIGDDS